MPRLSFIGLSWSWRGSCTWCLPMATRGFSVLVEMGTPTCFLWKITLGTWLQVCIVLANGWKSGFRGIWETQKARAVGDQKQLRHKFRCSTCSLTRECKRAILHGLLWQFTDIGSNPVGALEHFKRNCVHWIERRKKGTHCYSIVTALLQHCYSIVTALLQHSYSTVKAQLQHSYSTVTVLV